MLENAGPGDVRSAEVARPLSVSSSNNYWFLYYNRSETRMMVRNCTAVMGSQVQVCLQQHQPGGPTNRHHGGEGIACAALAVFNGGLARRLEQNSILQFLVRYMRHFKPSSCDCQLLSKVCSFATRASVTWRVSVPACLPACPSARPIACLPPSLLLRACAPKDRTGLLHVHEHAVPLNVAVLQAAGFVPTTGHWSYRLGGEQAAMHHLLVRLGCAHSAGVPHICMTSLPSK